MRPVRCAHPGGAEPCRYCLRRTCGTCHHGAEHLNACPETARRETGRRTTTRPYRRPGIERR